MSAALRIRRNPFSFIVNPRGGLVIRGQFRPILEGLIGEVRRTVAGARIHIDHSHAEVEFDLVVRGSGSYTLGETTYRLKPGTMFWVKPGRQHRLVRAPQLEMWVVMLRDDVVAADWMAEIAARPSHLLPGEELVDLDQLLSQVAQDSDEPATYNAGLGYVVRRAQRACRSTPPAHIKPMHPAVARALLLLREHGAERSLAQLAKETATSAPYLSRLLIEHTNRSFVDWRNRVRLERFMEIYRPGANLLAASNDAGFGSYARFHHVFSDVVGCSPSEWARQGDRRATLTPDDAAQNKSTPYGLPSSLNLSVRQRWLRLVPLVSPAIGAYLGKSFLKQLVSIDSSTVKAGQRPLAVSDASLPAGEVEQLIAALRKSDQAGADELARLVEMHDFPAIFSSLLTVFGLAPTDMAHAVVALLLLLWTAIHGAGDPSVDQVQAAGRQAQRALERLNLDPSGARAAYTAVLCHFVVGYHALQAARASGDARTLEQLGTAARASSRELFGSELTDIGFGNQGLVPRR
jgi:AraC-like DNA-binding protein